MPKRYLGNIITDTPTEPTENYEDAAASGVWSLAEAFAYTKAGLWPTAGNERPVPWGFWFGGGGESGSQKDTIERINISTTGNSTDFGNLTAATIFMGGFGVGTRAVYGGGNRSTSSVTSMIGYITPTTLGNATLFGTLSVSRQRLAGFNNPTRGVFTCGYNTNVLDYVTIATTGNATDFGDAAIESVRHPAAGASETRGLIAGGRSNSGASIYNVIQYVTTATTGDTQDFGDLTTARWETCGAANATRMLVFGGTTSGGDSNIIDYVTIATLGNAIDFGDLSGNQKDRGANASTTRATTNNYSAIEYVEIATTGNTSVFGNLTTTTERKSEGVGTMSGGSGFAA